MDRKLALSVLSAHQLQSHGMTYRSPDRCACGASTLPTEGDEDPAVRRARAFAAHQINMLTLAAQMDVEAAR